MEVVPIWAESIRSALAQLVSERRQEDRLLRAGLTPSRSALFVGPSGVGKTLAARWVARQLKWPLLVLNLSAVMSSFLGKTGSNLKNVIDYAKQFPCVLLLDELDAIAKRRDDAVEIGELKRLVTVLLQEVDEWPGTGLLLAATNHPELLDPAVWRRFDLIVDFPKPDESARLEFIQTFLGADRPDVAALAPALAIVLDGWSFAEIERELLRQKRNSLVSGSDFANSLRDTVEQFASQSSRSQRASLAAALSRIGYSQRKVQKLTGVSRDTQRKVIGKGT
jgi:SpoVK/Ycf46/Vps4 family AAA+-type ATPase